MGYLHGFGIVFQEDAMKSNIVKFFMIMTILVVTLEAGLVGKSAICARFLYKSLEIILFEKTD